MYKLSKFLKALSNIRKLFYQTNTSSKINRYKRNIFHNNQKRKKKRIKETQTSFHYLVIHIVIRSFFFLESGSKLLPKSLTKSWLHRLHNQEFHPLESAKVDDTHWIEEK